MPFCQGRVYGPTIWKRVSGCQNHFAEKRVRSQQSMVLGDPHAREWQRGWMDHVMPCLDQTRLPCRIETANLTRDETIFRHFSPDIHVMCCMGSVPEFISASNQHNLHNILQCGIHPCPFLILLCFYFTILRSLVSRIFLVSGFLPFLWFLHLLRFWAPCGVVKFRLARKSAKTTKKN